MFGTPVFVDSFFPPVYFPNLGAETTLLPGAAECPIQIFSRLRVNHLTRGQSSVEWEIDPRFADPLPHTFQLQAGRTGLQNADDWVNVGVAINNVFQLTDNEDRLYGRAFWTHYRVRLTTSLGTYYSAPADVLGNLSWRDWRIAREIVRKERMRHKKFVSEQGFLLKMRIYGEACPHSTDLLTEETTDSHCPICYGQGVVGGFFAPLAGQYMELALASVHEAEDIEMPSPGAVVVPARFLGTPQLHASDIWVHKSSDRRFYIHRITSRAEMRGVPLVTEVELRLAATTDIIYTIPLF